MTTEKLIEIASSALYDVLCAGCEADDEVKLSCYNCRSQAAREIADRLREHNALVLGKKYMLKDYTMHLTRDKELGDMFSIHREG